MKKQNYHSGQKVILIKRANGKEAGTELTILSHWKDNEYNCSFETNNTERFGNFFEDEFRLKTKFDELSRYLYQKFCKVFI